MATAEEVRQKVVKFAQELLLDEEDRTAITPALIAEKIEMVIAMRPKWGEGLDRVAVSDELIRRFSLWIGQDTMLTNEVGHVSWLNAARKTNWRYWQRYREWLEIKLSFKAVEALNQSSDTVLGLLEDPNRPGPWDRRGLVVGHVQSGKTGNYTGLICKAADAGYKIIIVLAGMHNNLRSQTQMRLDEGFLGYETKPEQDDIRVIGVGEIDGDPAIRPNYATNRSDRGDFNTKVARNLGITPEQRPWLFVVKKNKTVLDRLLGWIKNHVANVQDPETGRRIVTHLPLLLIDDEADHASVDTGEQVFDAEGNPDEEHLPKAINSRIRRILHSFSRSAYVGYTATPFANIFIHDRGVTREEGPDLFPAAFIINLAAPSDYIGPAKVFGLQTTEGREGGMPLVREITDQVNTSDSVAWMPQKHRNGHYPLHNGVDGLPPSLIEAIDSFILACAVRRLRGQENEHASMLVHVTRFNSVQKNVFNQIDKHVLHVRQRILRCIDHEPLLLRLRNLWEQDFCPTSEAIRELHRDLKVPDTETWERVLGAIPDAIQDIEVRMINGTAKDALDYVERRGTGLKVIAIGGDKLARGLTLEGLCVSYFLRASRMYDTLMQMGRWFGYRPGYPDLCRLYTTAELSDWFGHIADSAEELREEFELMAASGATPDDYGLKVQSHPVLLVTSRLKMRTAKNLMLSFSGQLLETIALFRDKDVLNGNLTATRRLLSDLGNPEVDPIRIRSGVRQQWKGSLWQNVPATKVVDFMLDYRTHPEAYKVKSALIAEFIKSMSDSGELIRWTVALIGGGEGDTYRVADEIEVKMLKRQNNGIYEHKYSIGRLMSPRDESIDLGDAAWNAALTLTREAWHADPGRLREAKAPEVPSGPAIRKILGFGGHGVNASPDRGLLLLYALDPKLAGANIFAEDAPPIIAFGISFPGSESGKKVEYKVNHVEWKQWELDYGSAE